MASSARAFLIDVARALAEDARETALPHIPSQTLRRGARAQTNVAVPGEAAVHIPHYWAIYVHDGRSPFRMPKGRYMVWYRDPSQDPRLKGGRPERRAAVRRLRLTKAEFHRLARAGQIVVASEIRKPTRPSPFFSNTGVMRSFLGKAGGIVQREWRVHLRRELGARLGFGKVLQIKP